MPDHPEAPSRRAVLAAALAAGALLTGCDVERPATRSPATPDPDAAALAAVLEQVVGIQALLAAAVAAHPSLATVLGPLDVMHSDHLAVLSPATTPDPTPVAPTPLAPVPDGTARRALVQVRTAETALAASLRAAAESARSGRFARVLACMGAGVGQHLAGLPGQVSP